MLQLPVFETWVADRRDIGWFPGMISPHKNNTGQVLSDFKVDSDRPTLFVDCTVCETESF
jgi:hypothetical protein